MLQIAACVKKSTNQIYMKRKYILVLNYIRKELRVMTVKMIQNHKKNGGKKRLRKYKKCSIKTYEDKGKVYGDEWHNN